MAVKSVWLSYDLGVRGDYDGLYRWLDSKGAKECGDSVAYFKFDFQGDLRKSLKDEISEAITMSSKTRIYVIYTENGSPKGSFLFGRRQATPWLGYAGGDSADDL